MNANPYPIPHTRTCIQVSGPDLRGLSSIELRTSKNSHHITPLRAGQVKAVTDVRRSGVHASSCTFGEAYDYLALPVTGKILLDLRGNAKGGVNDVDSFTDPAQAQPWARECRPEVGDLFLFDKPRRFVGLRAQTFGALKPIYPQLGTGVRGSLLRERRSALVDSIREERGNTVEVLGGEAGRHLTVTLPTAFAM